MQTKMYFTKIFSYTLLALLLFSQDTTGEQTFCGPALYDMLDGICINGYQKMLLPTKKRSVLPRLELEVDDTNNDIEPSLVLGDSPMFMGQLHGGIVNAMAKTRRRRYGVYDECCRKGCTFNELASYCS